MFCLYLKQTILVLLLLVAQDPVSEKEMLNTSEEFVQHYVPEAWPILWDQLQPRTRSLGTKGELILH